MWVLAPQLWEDLLTACGFRVEAIDLLPHPDESATVIQQLIRARRLPDRPARLSSRPRSTRAPAAHAAVGVGVGVGVGAILLSEHPLDDHCNCHLPPGYSDQCTTITADLAERAGVLEVRGIQRRGDHLKRIQEHRPAICAARQHLALPVPA